MPVDDPDALLSELSADVGPSERLGTDAHGGVRGRRGGEASPDRPGARPRAAAASTGRSIPSAGVTFELLSSRGKAVTTGHQAGVITLDLSESDDAHREFVRQQLGEQYRTVLGHLRHEIGHYFWPLARRRGRSPRRVPGTVRRRATVVRGRRSTGTTAPAPQPDWSTTYVSQYATMHPGRTGPRRSRTTSTSATGSRPPRRSGSTVGDPS